LRGPKRPQNILDDEIAVQIEQILLGLQIMH